MLGDNIKNIRLEKGFSQKYVAEKIGVSEAYISLIETNKRTNVGTDLLKKLSEALNVDITEFHKETSSIDEDYKNLSNLSLSHFDSLIKWSEDRLFKKHETVAIRSHMAELFLRYKKVIERLAYAQRDWDKSKESFSKFYKEKSEPLTEREIKELFLKQQLEESVDSLASWAKNLPSWITIEEEKYSINEIQNSNKGDSHLILNAAHEIEGSSDEDKTHDDAIMDDDDF